MAVNKTQETVNLLKKRIKNGVYAANPLPGAPALAQELGISYVTMRRAMRILLDENVVHQLDNGRLCATQHQEPALKVAMVTPPVYPNENKWVKVVSRSSEKYGCLFHHIITSESSEKAVFDVLDGDYDIIFMMSVEWNPLLVNKMLKVKEKIVTVHSNMTSLGFRFFDGYDPEILDILFAYLAERNYRKVDCFYTVTGSQYVNWRFIQWEKAVKKYNFTGRAYYAKVTPPEPLAERAYMSFSTLFGQNVFKDTEVIFVNNPMVARAVLRVLADNHLRVPEDIAVASIGEPEVATFNTPSITGIGTPDLQEKCDEIFKHYLGIAPKPDKLLFNHPAEELKNFDNVLFIGETTR